MILSAILRKMNIDFNMINEVEFETFGITSSVCDRDYCTFLDNEKFIHELPVNATMVLTTEQLKDKITNRGVCVVDNPRVLFFQIHNFMKEDNKYSRVKYQTMIGKDSIISKLSSIAESNVIIGNNVIIEEFVVIRENVAIDDNSIIRAGSVIGGEGFEFKHQSDGILPVKHLGGVIIGKNVEIQYNSCVDKAVFPWDNTVIGDNTKVDNLVHISHAVKIDKNVMIVAQSGIGGRVMIGDESWIGFGSTIRNGIKIGKSARVNMGAVVTKTVNDSESVSGNFAIEHSKFLNHIKSI